MWLVVHAHRAGRQPHAAQMANHVTQSGRAVARQRALARRADPRIAGLTVVMRCVRVIGAAGADKCGRHHK